MDTSLKLCTQYWSKQGQGCRNEGCDGIHLCKFLVIFKCKEQDCKLNHNLNDNHNSKILEKTGINNINIFTLKRAYKYYEQNRKSQGEKLPDVCKFYNLGGCKHEKKSGSICPCLHICRYFIEGNCKYGKTCCLSHNVNGNDQFWTCLEKNGFLKMKTWDSSRILEELKMQMWNDRYISLDLNIATQSYLEEGEINYQVGNNMEGDFFQGNIYNEPFYGDRNNQPFYGDRDDRLMYPGPFRPDFPFSCNQPGFPLIQMHRDSMDDHYYNNDFQREMNPHDQFMDRRSRDHIRHNVDRIDGNNMDPYLLPQQQLRSRNRSPYRNNLHIRHPTQIKHYEDRIDVNNIDPYSFPRQLRSRSRSPYRNNLPEIYSRNSRVRHSNSRDRVDRRYTQSRSPSHNRRDRAARRHGSERRRPSPPRRKIRANRPR